MQRILLIAAMLLPVASAMAAAPHVDIAAEVNTVQFAIDGVAHKTVTITYNVTNGDARAFALDINVDNGMNIGDRALRDFKVGESNSVSKGYGIFPGRFRDFINASLPNWQDPNYSPDTPWNSPGAENTGRGWPKIVAELGTLYSGDANKPALTGTLFTFDVNSEGGTDCNLKVAVNALRGGIVGQDAAQITDTNLPFSKKVYFVQGCTVPDCVALDLNSAECNNIIVAAGLKVGVEGNVPGTGQALRKVVAQNPPGGTVVACDTNVDFNEVSHPIKYMTAANSLYVNWVNRNRPRCWAYPRQCHGDADGKKQLANWVSNNDLFILRSAIGKAESLIPPTPTDPNPGICADYDHKKQLANWVSNNDLFILRAYIGKAESLVPMCGNIPNAPTYPSPDPNYHYWCLPTGGTCPTGQYCAPAGICPNTP